MFVRKVALNNNRSYSEKDLQDIAKNDFNIFRNNYPFLTNTTINNILDESTIINDYPEIVKFLKNELNWRDKIRLEILETNNSKKGSWGLYPSLYTKTNWQIKKSRVQYLGMYIINIMYWNFGAAVFEDWFNIIKPDSNAESADSLIKLKTDSQNNLIIKCVARGKFIYDNERNNKNLAQTFKIIESISEKVDWIKKS